VDSVQETFTKITSGLDSPMLVSTARADGGPAGCLVGFSTRCSVQPPRYLVCLSDKNRTDNIALRLELGPSPASAADTYVSKSVFADANGRWHRVSV
jgi:hypothetical protein